MTVQYGDGRGLVFNRSDYVPVSGIQTKHKLSDDEMNYALAKRAVDAMMVDGVLCVKAAQTWWSHSCHFGPRPPIPARKERPRARGAESESLDPHRFVTPEWISKWNGQVSVAAWRS